jgi:glucoamylase
VAHHAFWWSHAPVSGFPAGARLAVALPLPAIVHWGRDGWQDIADEPTRDTGLGFHVAVLEVSQMAAGSRLDFTWRSQQSGDWHNRDYAVTVEPAEPG